MWIDFQCISSMTPTLQGVVEKNRKKGHVFRLKKMGDYYKNNIDFLAPLRKVSLPRIIPCISMGEKVFVCRCVCVCEQ